MSSTDLTPSDRRVPDSAMAGVGARFGVLLVLTGGIALLGSLAQALQAKQSTTPPTAEGAIVQSSVDANVRPIPRRPSDRALEPRLESDGMDNGVSIFSACLAAGGAYLIYCGIRRPSK